MRAPKIAEPTRTWVAPMAIAVSKSALMPIDSDARPSRSAILASRAKCGAATSSSGGMHISPTMSSPCSVRQRSTKSSASSGGHAGLLRFGADIDLDQQARRPPLPRHLLGERRGQLVAVDGLDDVEQRDRVPGLVGLQRADQVQLDIGVSSCSAGHLPAASCTRFSPKTRWPACDHRWMAAASKVLETARGVPSGRPSGRGLRRGKTAANLAECLCLHLHAFRRSPARRAPRPVRGRGLISP